MPNRPTHGTKPVSRMAARRSRTRLGFAKGPPARYISPIFAIPMATNCARFVACRLPELARIEPEEGRPFRAVLAPERKPARPNRPRPSRTPSSGSVAGAFRRAPVTTGVRRCAAGILVAGVEDARRALRSVDGGADRKADLVDQAGPQKRPVRAAAAFEQQAFEPQLAVQDLQRQSEIEFLRAGEDVGDAILAEARQMRVGDPLGQHDDDRVAANIGPPPGDLTLRIE